MIRQLFSLFLIAAFLGSQAVACCGHTHEGSSDHTSRSHIHMGGHSHSHGPGHHHHHHGHQHDDFDHQHFPEQSDSPGLSSANSVDHDNDAVYFVEQQQVLLVSGDISLKKSPSTTTIPESFNYGYPLSQAQLLECSQPGLTLAHALYLQTSRLLL